MKKISIILLQLILFSFGYSEDLRPRYSAFGQVGLDIHLADFRALPNAPSCCPQYKIGYGLGYGFGAGFEFPINENTFVGSKLFYNSSQGLLASQESTLVIVNLTEQLGVIEHSIDSKFVIAGISPFIGKNFENTNISLGANIGYITSGTYSQKEQIVEPSNTGYFKENNSRIRNVSSGDIQNLNKLMFGIFAEISYDLKMNISNTLFFSPNLNLGYSFTNFVQNLDWKFFSAKAGIAIKYSPKDLKKTNYEYFKADTVKYLDENILSEVFHLGQTESKIQELEFEDSLVINKYYSRTDTIFKPRSKNISKKETKIEKTEIAELAAPKIIDTPQIKNEVINSKKTEIAEIPSIENIKKDTIVHFGTPREIVNNNLLYISEDPDGKNKLQSFFIKGKSVKEFEPILNYIFFDYNSEKIDTRYLKENYSKIEKSSKLYNYRKIFDLVANSLKENDKIILTGTIDPNTEKNNCELANNRAIAVKNHFIKYYGVNPDKITIKAGTKNCSPKDLTNGNSKESSEENRRVEIAFEKSNFLQKAIEKEYLISEKIIPNQVYFHFDSLVSYSKIEMFENNENKSNILLDKKYTINYTVSKNDIQKIYNENGLKINLRGIGNNNENYISQYNVPFKSNVSIDNSLKLNLNRFDFKQTEPDNTMKNEINSFITKIDNDYLISIKGNMDLLGHSLTNDVNAQKRIDAITKYIKKIKPNIKIIFSDYVPQGNYPNGIDSFITPEERFLSRVISIQAIKLKGGNDS